MITHISALTSSWQERYLITQVGQHSLAFLATWVTDIVVLESSKVLALPFYGPQVLGVADYQGRIVPLVSATSFFPTEPTGLGKKNLTTIRLSQVASNLTGVGVVVDRLVGSLPISEYQERVFQASDLPSSIWSLQRWA
jgi:chemotaxis signal transduction protein